MSCEAIDTHNKQSPFAHQSDLSSITTPELLKSIQFANNYLDTGLDHYSSSNRSISSIFASLKNLEPLSSKELGDKIRAAKKQRELDLELYGPNLPEDSQSELLDLVSNHIEILEQSINSISTLEIRTITILALLSHLPDQ